MAKQDQRIVSDSKAATTMKIELGALKLLARDGVDKVTVQDVAHVAGISRRTFYRYFDSIEELCLAAPRRALLRLARDFRARPASESVSDAFINATLDKQISDEELALQRLGMEIYLRDREAWMRIMARLDKDAVEILSGAIGERLRLMGADESLSQLLAKVILCVINDVPPAFDRPVGGDSSAPVLRQRLNQLAESLRVSDSI